MGRFDQTAIDLAQGGLHQPGHKGRCSNRQRHHGRPGTDGGTRDQTRQRNDGHQQDDEGGGAQRIHDPAHDLVGRAVLQDAAMVGQAQEDAQRNTDQTANQARYANHDQRLPEGIQQQLEHHFRKILKHRSQSLLDTICTCTPLARRCSTAASILAASPLA
ncbi:hypothetical protein SDC9_190654 [bioreactor metagenome]|uniref:Uncharacterized protein n=1 Tax=bioreactor metagenome TaxID=1076179 RepID=A0A645HVK8_9ZZZZ